MGNERRFAMASVAAVLAMGASPARSQAPGITYDCDTATERWSELILPAPSARFVVKGEVRLERVASLDRVAPISRLMVSEASAKPGDSPADFGGFSLLALPARKSGTPTKEPSKPAQFLQWDEARNGTMAEQKPMPASDYADSLPFTLAFDGKTVAISIDGMQRTIPVAVKRPVVRIVCSTGQFLYTNLTIAPMP